MMMNKFVLRFYETPTIKTLSGRFLVVNIKLGPYSGFFFKNPNGMF